MVNSSPHKLRGRSAAICAAFGVASAMAVGGAVLAPTVADAATAAPALTTAPSISGTYAVGGALTTTDGTFSGSGLTDTILWARTTQQGVPGTTIAGATGASYTLTAADKGDYVYSLVTATNSGGKASGYGWTTQTIAAAPPVAAPALTGAPTITGTYAVGGSLKTTDGTFSGSGLTDTVQWARSTQQGVPGTAIAGATGASYTLTAADAGDYVYSLVTATNSAGKASGYGYTTQVVAAASPSGASDTAQFNISDDGDTTTVAQAKQDQIVQLQYSPTVGTLVDQIHAADPGVKVLMYSDTGYPGDSTAWTSCTTSAEDAAGGSSWYLYDGSSQLSYMNAGSAGFEAACASHAIALAKSQDFDGIFWDNVAPQEFDIVSNNTCVNAAGAAACSLYNGASMTAWQANEYSLVKALGAATSQAGLMTVINDGSGTTSQWAQWGATPGISGQMEESFVGSYLGTSVPYSQWQEELANEAWSEANGKYDMTMHYDPNQNQESLDTFGLSSMLLAAGGETSYDSTVTRLCDG